MRGEYQGGGQGGEERGKGGLESRGKGGLESRGKGGMRADGRGGRVAGVRCVRARTHVCACWQSPSQVRRREDSSFAISRGESRWLNHRRALTLLGGCRCWCLGGAQKRLKDDALEDHLA